MATAGRLIVVIDASVLINFLAVDRLGLLTSHPQFRFLVTDHVRGEVTEDDELARLDAALDAQLLEQVSVVGPRELELFAKLTADGRLGVGECVAIALASVQSFIVALDDKAARKQCTSLDPSLQVLDTVELVLSLIRLQVLTVEEADAIKFEWEMNHRFTLKFASFGDLPGP
jgi:predicted nucleic acid-binding protein